MKATVMQVNGEKVSALRAELGWNQQQLGTEAGLHAMTVSKVERNNGGTEIGTVWLLAKVFTEQLGRVVTVDDLLAEPEPEEAAAAVP